MIFAGCGGNKNQQAASEEEDGNVKVWLSEDSTLYGLCGEGSAMNTLQLITDTGDTLNLSVTDAKEKNHVLGGYSVGDDHITSEASAPSLPLLSTRASYWATG